MPFSLSEVVPWGRSYEEYISMFSLSSAELQHPILGCSDGPANFNSMLTRQGGSVVSVDPLYAYTAGQIKKQIDATYRAVLEQTRTNRDEFVWDIISSVEELGRIRMAAMEDFLNDYNQGRMEKRYIAAALPHLPFDDGKFTLALCSHFLFLYSKKLSARFHTESIIELCRTAQTVRIFPVLELGSTRSRHLYQVMEELRQRKHHVELRKVEYEFQRGGNEMLEVRRANL